MSSTHTWSHHKRNLLLYYLSSTHYLINSLNLYPTFLFDWPKGWWKIMCICLSIGILCCISCVIFHWNNMLLTIIFIRVMRLHICWKRYLPIGFSSTLKFDSLSTHFMGLLQWLCQSVKTIWCDIREKFEITHYPTIYIYYCSIAMQFNVCTTNDYL